MLKPQPQTDKYSKSGIYQIKCLDCHQNTSDKQEEHSTPGIKNTFMTSETTTVTQDYTLNNNRYHGNYNNREEGKISEYTGKVSHL
jgi:hypothetical protein